jgi:hypothetical protein
MLNGETIDEHDRPQLCDAVDCNEVAIEQVTVSAGRFGTLILSLCRNCICKFVEEPNMK